jgi:hypothetical protein
VSQYLPQYPQATLASSFLKKIRISLTVSSAKIYLRIPWIESYFMHHSDWAVIKEYILKTITFYSTMCT